jgi:rhamnosyltransferase
LKTALIILTRNAKNNLPPLIESLKFQTMKADYFLVLDSSSTDGTEEIAKAAGANFIVIPLEQFNHGGTRQICVDLVPDADIILFLTQDAILASPDSLEKLLTCFNDKSVSVAYGRQLPRKGAAPIEAHARIFNYPPYSQEKSLEDSTQLGIKTAFISNSFAAYRRESLISVGGFPENIILSEDMYVTAKMLMAGWKVLYCAESAVYHSHDFSIRQEFSRYYDIGVCHSKEFWILENFGRAELEGVKYIISEIKYLFYINPLLIPLALFRDFVKLLGYKMGLKEKYLPVKLKRHMSMDKGYW